MIIRIMKLGGSDMLNMLYIRVRMRTTDRFVSLQISKIQNALAWLIVLSYVVNKNENWDSHKSEWEKPKRY